MIRGSCSPRDGAYLTGFVYFPPPTDAVIEVPFLVDTGAACSTLGYYDLQQLADSSLLDTTLAPTTIRAAGGATFQPEITQCGIAFPHVTGGFSQFWLQLALLRDESGGGTPSLLGMDILARGPLLVDAPNRRVEFDPPTGLTEIPPIWSGTP